MDKQRIEDAFAVTLRFPWAHLIAWGYVEELAVMKYVPAYEGPLIIHAGNDLDDVRIPKITRIMHERFGLIMEVDQRWNRPKRLAKQTTTISLADLDGNLVRQGQNSQYTAITDLGKIQHVRGQGVIWPLKNIEPLPQNVTGRGWPGLWKPHIQHIERMIDAVHGTSATQVDQLQAQE